VDSYKFSLSKRFDLLIIIGGVQLIQTIWAQYVNSQGLLILWVIITSLVLGFGIPITFPLFFELIPREDRGVAAGLIAGIAYFIGNLSPFEWTLAGLTLESLSFMGPGILALVIFKLTGLLKKIIPKEKEESVIKGRFVGHSYIVVTVLMFAIFFIDSLGFLRILEEVTLYDQTWHGTYGDRVILGTVHLITGILAGWLYKKTDYWVIGIVTLTLFIVCDIAMSLYTPFISHGTVLFVACLYCTTVSVYTVNNFAVWADLSTRENAGKHAAVGVAIGGWLASFLSTSMAYYLMNAVSFSVHVAIPGIIAGIMLGVTSLFLKFNKDQETSSKQTNE
jgi:MFS family permease